MPDLISVIMPAYNAAAYIRQAVESVQAQSWTHWELLIVNDGSTDDTAQIVFEMARADDRVRLLEQTNGKQGKARNLALHQAAGQWIAFLDADDVWMPLKLEKQIAAIRLTGADLLFADANWWDGSTVSGSLGAWQGWLEGRAGLLDMLQCNRIPILTVLAKREAIDSVGGFCEALSVQNAEDYQLWLKMLATGKRFYGMKEALAGYRRHSASATAADPNSFWPACYALLELRNHCPEWQQEINDALEYRLNDWITGVSNENRHQLHQWGSLLSSVRQTALPFWFKWAVQWQVPLSWIASRLKKAHA